MKSLFFLRWQFFTTYKGTHHYRVTVLGRVPHTCILCENSIIDMNLKLQTSWHFNLEVEKGRIKLGSEDCSKYYYNYYKHILTTLTKILNDNLKTQSQYILDNIFFVFCDNVFWFIQNENCLSSFESFVSSTSPLK